MEHQTRSRTPRYDAYMKEADREMKRILIAGALLIALVVIVTVIVSVKASDDCAARGGHLVTGTGSTVVGTTSNGGVIVGYAAGPTTCEPNR